MRGKRSLRWLLPITLWAILVGRGGLAQTAALPPALVDPPASSATNSLSTSLAPSEGLSDSSPPAPPPIPGPAGEGLPVGGMDAKTPQGLPINLATAMHLSGVRPVDIAAATALIEQALALQLQAKVLWIPSLNAGVDYFRHDGVQQNLFTGPNFRKGRQSFFVGGGPSLNVGLADAIFEPLAARRVVA